MTSVAFEDSDQERFLTDGYLILRKVIDRSELDAIEAWLLGQVVHRDPGARPQTLREWQPSSSDRARLQRTLYSCPAFRAVASSDRLLAAMQGIFGEPAFLHPRRFMRVVTANPDGYVMDPHQDHAYTQGSEQTVTGWIPLHDVTIADSCLLVWPGSHLGGLVTDVHEPWPGRYVIGGLPSGDPRWTPIECERGDVVLLHSLVVHASRPASSGLTRLSFDCRYQPQSEPMCATELTPPFGLDVDPLGWVGAQVIDGRVLPPIYEDLPVDGLEPITSEIDDA